MEDTKSNELCVKLVGVDNWYRPVYIDKQGRLYKDVNLGCGVIDLCTASSNDFYGEPEASIGDEIKIRVVKSFNKKERGER